MYIALLLMLTGMLAGRLCRRFLAGPLLPRLVFLSVLFLLFTLGLSIGANDALFDNLPAFGGSAGIITAGVLAGSLLMAWLFQSFLRGRGLV